MNIRSSLLAWCLGVGGLAAAWQQAQDPPPSPSPSPSPVPVTTRAPAKVPGKPEPHVLEGFYELRKRVIGGRDEPKPSRGYLAITRRHMLLCLAGPGSDPDLPLLRAGVRTWHPDADKLCTEVALGYYTDERGGIHVEAPGTAEVRRFFIGRGIVRLYQDESSFLEFERIE
ncbi:MAG: hypothetical protein ABIP94_24380 [Planctomycetota bacterium]